LGARSIFGPEQLQSSDTGKTLGGSSEQPEVPRRRDKPLAFPEGQAGYCDDRQPAFQDVEISTVTIPRMVTAMSGSTTNYFQADNVKGHARRRRVPRAT
jgi:hypothetical protein